MIVSKSLSPNQYASLDKGKVESGATHWVTWESHPKGVNEIHAFSAVNWASTILFLVELNVKVKKAMSQVWVLH